jgi:ribonuclease HI
MSAQVFLYVDGACKGNPGPGGYAAVLICNGREKEIVGGESRTTNNRMELMAVIAGLRSLKRPCRVTMVTDSRYVAVILTGGQAKTNFDLVHEARRLAGRHQVTVQQVAGHSRNASAGSAESMNNRCDRLAQAEALWQKALAAVEVSGVPGR